MGLLVNVLTDNDNRANADVNLVAKKHSLKIAATNSVRFKFNKKARIDISSIIEEDQLMEICLESDVSDYELRTVVDGCPLSPQEDGKSVVYVDLPDMVSMRDALKAKNFEIEVKLANIPVDGFISLNDEDFDLNMGALSAFEALDDVDSVEHNIEMVED